MYKDDFTSRDLKDLLFKGFRNDAYALNLIEQVGATVEKVTLVPKYFAELQWGEEFATLEDNPSSAEE